MRNSDSPLLYRVGRAIVVPLFKLVFLLRSTGTHHVPAEGGALLAANHASFLDPVFVGAACPRRLRFMARDTLFRNHAFSGLITALGAFPVRRGGVSKEAFRTAIDLLRGGSLVLLFPEGTRTPDGVVHPFKTGISMLAERSEVPVVPVAIEGSYRVWPRHRALPRPARVRVCFGEPLRYGGEGYERFAEEVRSRVVRMMEERP